MEESGEQHPMKRLGGRRSSGDSSALLYHVQSQASERLALLRWGLGHRRSRLCDTYLYRTTTLIHVLVASSCSLWRNLSACQTRPLCWPIQTTAIYKLDHIAGLLRFFFWYIYYLFVVSWDECCQRVDWIGS